jgi:hypothetical protein
MATKEITMYYVECDNCKDSLFENDEYSCWNEPSIATEMADNIEGSVIDHDGKDYCCNCARFDDEDNLILDLSRTKQC